MSNHQDINVLVKNEIIKPTLDSSIDYSELILDSFLGDGILKEVPLVKSLVNFYYVTQSIKARHDTKKILTFFQEFHKKKFDTEKYTQFLGRFNTEPEYQSKIIETIVLLNERFLEIEKSKVLANLLKAHIEGFLTWDELQNIYITLDSIHIAGFLFLKEMADCNWYNNQLRNDEKEPLMLACGIGNRHGNKFSINLIGQKLFEFGIKPTLN